MDGEKPIFGDWVGRGFGSNFCGRRGNGELDEVWPDKFSKYFGGRRPVGSDVDTVANGNFGRDCLSGVYIIETVRGNKKQLLAASYQLTNVRDGLFADVVFYPSLLRSPDGGVFLFGLCIGNGWRMGIYEE